MFLLKLFIFSCAVISPCLAICKESDNFVFECELWEDVVKLPEKGTVKQLTVKNRTVSIVCDEATFREFHNLTVINVHPGGFTEIQKECFNGRTRLKYVQFMENDLKSVALDSLNRSIVERLWLNGNRLKQLNFNGISLPVLKSLDLSGNLLSNFEIATNNIPDLHILDLSFNNLTTVAVESFSLSFLKLQGNLLTDLSAESVKGKSIRMLYLSENKFTEIRGSLFANVPRVEFVHFEKNPVTRIDLSNFNVTSLRCTDQNLWLMRRQREVPLSVDVSWDQVQQLIMSNNSLDRLDVFKFSKSQKIAELLLDHNVIREIKRDDLRQLKELVAVDLSHNRISSVEDGAFEDLIKLHSLSLAYNCIHGLSDHIFLNLNSLFSIDLSKNIMTYFVISGWNSENNSVSLTQYHVRLTFNFSTVACDY